MPAAPRRPTPPASMGRRPAAAPPTPSADAHAPLLADVDPEVNALVDDLISRVADRWTMVVLEALAEHGTLRFTRLGELVRGVSPKMLTQTLRRMERDGLVTRTAHPVIPPRVEYRRTELGESLGAAFCGVWHWAEANLARVAAARGAFDAHARHA